VNVRPGNFALLGDRRLELLQFHFHSPSEHAFDGARAAMEAHLVHRDATTGDAMGGAALQQRAGMLTPRL
jgi:carbonic anhydrase